MNQEMACPKCGSQDIQMMDKGGEKGDKSEKIDEQQIKCKCNKCGAMFNKGDKAEVSGDDIFGHAGKPMQ